MLVIRVLLSLVGFYTSLMGKDVSRPSVLGKCRMPVCGSWVSCVALSTAKTSARPLPYDFFACQPLLINPFLKNKTGYPFGVAGCTTGSVRPQCPYSAGRSSQPLLVLLVESILATA